MRYKVLWIDDEFNRQLDFIGEAEQEGIDIIAVESHEEGMIKLDTNLNFYHAVILDAKVKLKKEDTVPSVDGLKASRDRLLEINSNNSYLPFFIFTGQPDYVASDIFKGSYGKYYIKAVDNELLFSDLKEAIEKKDEYQIQKRYEEVFKVCTDKYIGSQALKDLMAILKQENTISSFQNPDLFFNAIRKIVEDLFTACNKFGLLPDVFKRGGIGINESSRFLCGQAEKGYVLSSPIFDKICAESMKNILAVCQNGSHRLEVDAFIKKVNSPYLLLSITYQLMDILLWFKTYVDENPSRENNMLNAKLIETDTTVIVGVIKKDKIQNFYVEGNILRYGYINACGYKVGDRIKILGREANFDEKTKHLYAKVVITSEKIQ